MAHPSLPRAGLRAAAVLGTAALGVGAFALPAAAQAPEPIETFLDFTGPFAAEGDPDPEGFEIYFGDDFTPGAHTVTMTIAIDIADNAFLFSGGDIGDRCEVNAAATEIVCTEAASDSGIRFEFDVEVPDAANVGTYPYVLDVAVDGDVVHTEAKDLSITPPDNSTTPYPFLHGAVEFTGVEQGSSVEVRPEFYQEDPLEAGAEAVIVEFDGSDWGSGVDVNAAYDNCIDDGWGVACVVTEFSDAPGTAYTVNLPAVYTVSETAPGPFAICGCSFKVSTATAEVLQNRFGTTEFGAQEFKLQVLDGEPGSELTESYGLIRITTTENPVDLSIDPINVKGAKGTETTIKVEYTNEGPADAISHPDGPGSFAVVGNLPTGVKLLPQNEQNWDCYEEVPLDHYVPAIDAKTAENLDFACHFISLDSGESGTLDLKVEITSDTPASDGMLAVVLQDGFVPDEDLKNNTAKFTLNAASSGNGTGKLPKTGTSMGMIIVGAAAVLVVGVVLLVVTSRRRKAGAGIEE